LAESIPLSSERRGDGVFRRWPIIVAFAGNIQRKIEGGRGVSATSARLTTGARNFIARFRRTSLAELRYVRWNISILWRQ